MHTSQDGMAGIVRELHATVNNVTTALAFSAPKPSIFDTILAEHRARLAHTTQP
jgi:hypothetical protein